MVKKLSSAAIAQKIDKEQANLKKLQEQSEKIAEKIQVSSAKIEELELQRMLAVKVENDIPFEEFEAWALSRKTSTGGD